MRISDWSSDVCSSDLACAGDKAKVRRTGKIIIGKERGRRIALPGEVFHERLGVRKDAAILQLLVMNEGDTAQPIGPRQVDASVDIGETGEIGQHPDHAVSLGAIGKRQEVLQSRLAQIEAVPDRKSKRLNSSQ